MAEIHLCEACLGSVALCLFWVSGGLYCFENIGEWEEALCHYSLRSFWGSDNEMRVDTGSDVSVK